MITLHGKTSVKWVYINLILLFLRAFICLLPAVSYQICCSKLCWTIFHKELQEHSEPHTALSNMAALISTPEGKPLKMVVFYISILSIELIECFTSSCYKTLV